MRETSLLVFNWLGSSVPSLVGDSLTLEFEHKE